MRVPSKQQIQHRWNRCKGDADAGIDGLCPWWRSSSTYAFQSAFADADQAWKNWLDSLTGQRAGRRVGLPRFKAKNRSRASFRLHHDVKSPTIRLDSYRRLRVPRIGSLRLHDSAKRLSRALDRGGHISSVTIARGGHRWYASVLVDEPDTTPGRETQGNGDTGPPGPSHAQVEAGRVGVDLGVHTLAALSTGETIPNPRHEQRARKRLVKAQRQLSRTQKNSHNRGKARERLARRHHELAESRKTSLHQVTKTLATRWGEIAVEDLAVQGMTASARGTIDTPGRGVRQKAGLNRAILDTAPGELRRQLAYKTRWYGSRLAVCDQWHPSSKTCSGCGTVKAKLSLSERTYTCQHCGLSLDRDINAAINIAEQAATSPPARGKTQNADGGHIRPQPLGQQPTKRQAHEVTSGEQSPGVTHQSKSAGTTPETPGQLVSSPRTRG